MNLCYQSFLNAEMVQDINSSPPSAALYVSMNWISIGWDNGLLPGQCQAIISGHQAVPIFL